MPRNTVIAFCGLPGSGKSTLARGLAAETGWQVLDRDAMRVELFPVDGYSEAAKQQLNETLQERMQSLLQAGASVILDGMTMSRHAERERFRRLAEQHGARWYLAWLDCDVTIAKQRVARDTLHPAADRDEQLVDEVAARFEIPRAALRLDAELDIQRQLQVVLTYVRQQHLQEGNE